MRHIWIGFLLVTIALVVSACGSVGEFKVMDGWMLPGKKGDNSMLYFIISNATNTDDVLIDVNVDVATSAKIYLNANDENGANALRVLTSVPVPAQKEIILKPDRLYIMLTDLRQDLRTGDKVEIELIFEETGGMIIQAEVRSN